MAEVDWRSGRLEEAIDRMEKSFAIMSNDKPDEDLARLAAQLGRLLHFKGENDLAYERTEVALQIAETLWLPEIISEALNTKALFAMWRARLEEALALLKHSLEVALENDIPSSALRAYGNLADMLQRRDRHDEALEVFADGFALARKVGNHFWERQLAANSLNPLYYTGRWNQAVERADQFAETPQVVAGAPSFLSGLLPIFVHRGEMDRVQQLLSVFEGLADSADLQDRAAIRGARSVVLHAQGNARDALASAREAMEIRGHIGLGSEDIKAAFDSGVEAALELGDASAAESFLAIVDESPPGSVPPFLRAETARFRARMHAAIGEVEAATSRFKTAAGMFRELGMPFWLAATLLEHGEWLTGSGRADETGELLDEARMIFERLNARPWLDRLAGIPVAATAGRSTGP
jgi:tetratricopeptide (TPR) repeat protein